jgi:hypothetical protein
VKLERLFRHVGRERVVRIGEVGQREGHDQLLGNGMGLLVLAAGARASSGT